MQPNCLKLAILSLALVGTAPAFASIAPASSGNGSLILSVYDPVAQVSYTANLNILFNNFLPGSVAATTDQSWNLSSDANWHTFLSLTSAADGLQYSVVAGSNISINNQQYFITSNSALATIKSETNSQLKGFSAVDNYIAAVNLSPNFANGSLVEVSQSPADDAYLGNAFRSNWDGKFTGNDMANLGATLSFYELGLNGTANLSKVKVTQFGNNLGAASWDLSSGGLLTYEVPASTVAEPETCLLFGLGLGAAVLARRTRKSI